jgi:hypothetical protein
MRWFSFVIILLFFICNSFAQRGIIVETSCFDSDEIDTSALKEKFLIEMEKDIVTAQDYYSRKDSIKSAVSGRISVSENIAPEFFLALLSFPELIDKEIVVKYKSIQGTMNARPALVNIFRKKTDRKYILLINDNKGRHKGLELEEITFNARVGWFGHEFAHLYTYQQMSNFGTIVFTLKYLFSNRFTRKVERYTNLVAIKKGLTFQIYQGEQFILMNSALSDTYRRTTVYRALTYREYICLWNLYQKANYFRSKSTP